MAPTTVIADASALISLRGVDQVSLLPGLFRRVVMPPSAVAEATQRGFTFPNWLEVRPLGRDPDARVLAARLGAGESEVLCLGLELPDSWLILDDADARDLARKLGLRMLHSQGWAGLVRRHRPNHA